MPRPRSRKNIARKRNTARRENVRALKEAISANAKKSDKK